MPKAASDRVDRTTMRRTARPEPNRSRRRALCRAALVAAGLTGSLAAVAGAAENGGDRVVQLLSRATFGPTPELVAEVRGQGEEAWLAEQLAPERIDDPGLDARLARYPALSMDPEELLASYPRPRGDGAPEGLGPPRRIIGELQAAQLTRAVHARAQLREVLTDLWLNHFSVFAAGGPMPYLAVSYLRDAIRPHVLGRFEDLLRATAESPAMLFFLDNFASSRPGRRGGGINENYARELLELHTVGVERGFTQADVVAVARAFTGWSIGGPADPAPLTFLFRPRRHEPGAKVVLSTTIPPGGKDEGDRILALLARDPATAEHVARKLVTRFVSDGPPEALVQRIRDVYLATDGQLARVVAEVLSSSELRDADHRGGKVKSPLELVASALRAAGADVDLGVAAARLVGELGQGLLLARQPSGWPETAAEVLSPGGMVARFRLAARVAAGRIDGVVVDTSRWAELLRSSGAAGLARTLLAREASPATLAALEQARADGAGPVLLAALVLASPDFQRQ